MRHAPTSKRHAEPDLVVMSTPGDPPPRERISADIDGSPASLARVREDIAVLAQRAGFDDRVGDVTLVVAELVANALEHGEPPVHLDAWNDGRLVIEVSDQGGGFDRASVWQRHPPSPHGSRGRGLWITRQLMDIVEVHSDNGGSRIRAELSPDPHLGA